MCLLVVYLCSTTYAKRLIITSQLKFIGEGYLLIHSTGGLLFVELKGPPKVVVFRKIRSVGRDFLWTEKQQPTTPCVIQYLRLVLFVPCDY